MWISCLPQPRCKMDLLVQAAEMQITSDFFKEPFVCWTVLCTKLQCDINTQIEVVTDALNELQNYGLLEERPSNRLSPVFISFKYDLKYPTKLDVTFYASLKYEHARLSGILMVSYKIREKLENILDVIQQLRKLRIRNLDNPSLNLLEFSYEKYMLFRKTYDTPKLKRVVIEHFNK